MLIHGLGSIRKHVSFYLLVCFILSPIINDKPITTFAFWVQDQFKGENVRTTIMDDSTPNIYNCKFLCDAQQKYRYRNNLIIFFYIP